MKSKTHNLIALIAACLLATNASYAENDGHDHSEHAECKHEHRSEDKDEHKEESNAGHGHETHGHDEHTDHDHQEKQAGPNGGRLITSVEPHLEFFVTKEGFVQITFLNDAKEVVTAEDQSVSLIGGDRQNPIRLRFVKKGQELVSTEPLPEGNNLPIILSIKRDKASKTVREKFNLNLRDCPTCDYKEYACVCDHG